MCPLFYFLNFILFFWNWGEGDTVKQVITTYVVGLVPRVYWAKAMEVCTTEFICLLLYNFIFVLT